MTSAEEIWRNKSDDEVFEAIASLDEYTEDGKQIILREAERRGLNARQVVDTVDAMRTASTSGSRSHCAYCGTRILFGGTSYGGLRFCNDECRRQGVLIAISHRVPDAKVNERLWALHQGACPECGGPGPVDVEKSYRVWSAGIVTSWSSRPHIACRRCGTRARIKDAVFSLFLGWWALPWGVFVTPVQIARNILESFHAHDRSAPSPQLEKLVRLGLASQLVTSEPNEALRPTGAR